MDEKDIDVFFCYSVELRDYLYQNGLRYKVAAIHPNNHHMFWLYIKTDKLDKLLTAYSEKKSTER